MRSILVREEVVSGNVIQDFGAWSIVEGKERVGGHGDGSDGDGGHGEGVVVNWWGE